MLVLTRKLNESILIGDNIKVTLLGMEGDRIKVGVDAPMDMRIFRAEMVKKAIEENKLAAGVGAELGALAEMREKRMHEISGK